MKTTGHVPELKVASHRLGFLVAELAESFGQD